MSVEIVNIGHGTYLDFVPLKWHTGLSSEREAIRLRAEWIDDGGVITDDPI